MFLLKIEITYNKQLYLNKIHVKSSFRTSLFNMVPKANRKVGSKFIDFRTSLFSMVPKGFKLV